MFINCVRSLIYWNMVNLLLVVTGASRGFGREIAVSFLNSYSLLRSASVDHIHTILIARSEEGLNKTKDIILEQQSSARLQLLDVEVTLHAMDLSDLNSLDGNLDNVFDTIRRQQTTFDRLILINNAGSLGHLGPFWETDKYSLKDVKQTVDLNITSSLWFSTRFVNFAMEKPISEMTIVNVSSLVAIVPFPTMALYSAGKAARDMYHACCAKELLSQSIEGNERKIKTLNYAPGPLETDMASQLRSAEDLDSTIRQSYQNQLIDPTKSAQILVRLVLENDFASGSHVDYYDAVQLEKQL